MNPSLPGPLLPVPDPGRLPHPLDDPLRFYRRLLGFLLIPFFIVVILGLGIPRLGGPDWGLALDQALLVLTFVVALAVWRLLPRQATTAVYLRSFRNDPVAYPIRTVVSGALGPGFRLSGIRDPRRRWPWLVRHLLYLPFLLRYCRPRFMNLEAGADWKARLWRSLGAARCAIIDLTELTPFVLDEVQLALTCLGPERVLFVVDASLGQSDWEEKIASQLTVPVSAEALRLAIWEDTPQGRRAFANQVRHFARHVPEAAAGLRPGAWPLTQSEQPIQGRSGGRELAFVELGLACVVSYGLILALDRLGRATPPSLRLLWFVPVLGLLLMNVVFLLQYLVESGSARDWVASGLFVGSGGLAAAGLLAGEWLSPPEGLLGAAGRATSANNLRRIALAIQAYDDNYGRLPPAVGYTPDGKPLVSWRVLLLPQLDEEALFNEFHLGEPWDSPHNLGLLEHMPRVYRSPYHLAPVEPTKTHYRVFVGRRTPLGRGAPSPGAPFRQLLFGFGQAGGAPVGVFDPGYKLFDLAKLVDARETVLVVEAREPVPWTKPEELEIEAFDLRDPHRALGISRLGFYAAMADGSTRLFERSEKRPANAWEALFTGGLAGAP
jgi:hypothetical protein